MQKGDIEIMPEYFNKYIDQVADLPVIEALHTFGAIFLAAEKSKLIALGDLVYEQDKWTVKDILQHIIDTERIFTYRALRFARNDATELSGFDENEYAKEANVSERTIEDLLIEFAAVRQSTIGLFLGFNEQHFLKVGVASNKSISVLALGFTIAGHVIHHMNIIKQRYYPLIEN